MFRPLIQCAGRGKEDDDVGDFLRIAEASHREAVANIVVIIGLARDPIAIPAIALHQDRARRDRVRPHAMRHELQGPAFSVEDQRRLGRAILAGTGKLRRPTGNRCHVGHRRARAAAHMRQREAHHAHRLQQVHLQGDAPVLIRAIGDAACTETATDIVDHDVDAAERYHRCLNQPRRIVGVCHVGDRARYDRSGAAQRRLCDLQCRGRTRRQHQPTALSGQCTRGGEADAAAGARDQRDLVTQLQVHQITASRRSADTSSLV
jgi:hypothetical protein